MPVIVLSHSTAFTKDNNELGLLSVFLVFCRPHWADLWAHKDLYAAMSSTLRNTNEPVSRDSVPFGFMLYQKMRDTTGANAWVNSCPARAAYLRSKGYNFFANEYTLLTKAANKKRLRQPGGLWTPAEGVPVLDLKEEVWQARRKAAMSRRLNVSKQPAGADALPQQQQQQQPPTEQLVSGTVLGRVVPRRLIVNAQGWLSGLWQGLGALTTTGNAAVDEDQRGLLAAARGEQQEQVVYKGTSRLYGDGKEGWDSRLDTLDSSANAGSATGGSSSGKIGIPRRLAGKQLDGSGGASGGGPDPAEGRVMLCPETATAITIRCGGVLCSLGLLSLMWVTV